MATNYKNLTLMVVDDNLPTCTLLTAAFKDCNVLCHPKASDALRALDHVTPDLFILDLWLAEKESGLMLARQLRSNPATQHVPIIGITALSSISSEAEEFCAVVDLLLSKPFNLKKLRQHVEQFTSSATF